MGGNIKKNNVAVIVPLSDRGYLTDSEKISLRQLELHLSGYDNYFVCNKKFEIKREGYKYKYFPETFFGSAEAHNRLLIDKSFYDAFEDYEYILIYHLDALVFSDQLMYWCNQGYDYIGPPWIKSDDLPWLKENAVGNGGFALRNVRSFQKMLASQKKWKDPKIYLEKLKGEKNPLKFLKHLKSYLWLKISPFNNIRSHLKHYADGGGNEDRFWWYHGQKYNPEFRIAPVHTALKFGFEAAPKKCFEMNNYELPFGCHAWETFDKGFWEPFIKGVNKDSFIQESKRE